MKHKNICKLLGSIFCFMILLGMQSCDGMSELSDRFLDDGSIIYAAKVDSVSAHPGDGRVELEVFIKTQRIDYVRIYWNNKSEYKDLTVNSQPGVYNISFELDELAYVFDLVSVDKYGNESLPFEVSAEVYGDNFRQVISNRLIRRADYDIINKKLSVAWGSAVNYGLRNEIVYTNTSGKEVTRRVDFEEATTVISDWDSDTEFKYRTQSIPDPLAIDTFYTDYSPLSRVYLDKSSWVIDSYSSQVNGGKENVAANAVNGKYDDRWHSAENGYPEWMIIDFGAETDVRGFGVTPSVYDVGSKAVDERFPTTVRFEVSSDKTNWTSLGDFPSTNRFPGEQMFEVAPTKARYYRFTGVSSAEGIRYMVLSELDAYLYY